jgi:hypothetical protein
MRRAVLLLATMALTIALSSGVAQAIINGQPDTGPKAHPYVGALVTKVEGQLQNFCSGTLISATVFLTAGHCTDSLIREDLPTYVSFDPTYRPGASKVVSATSHAHPRFCFPEDKADCAPPERPEVVGGLVRDIRYDLGVAVLEDPVRMAAAMRDALQRRPEWLQGFTEDFLRAAGDFDMEAIPAALDKWYPAAVACSIPGYVDAMEDTVRRINEGDAGDMVFHDDEGRAWDIDNNRRPHLDGTSDGDA